MRKGWSACRIDDVAKVVNGGTPKTKVADYWGGEHLWITPAEMGGLASPYMTDSRRKLSDAGLQHSSATLVPSHSVILSTRAPIGHLIINSVPMAFNQGCRGIVPSENIHYKYLYFFLSFSVDLLNDLGSGTTFKELAAGKLKKVEIPVPPLREQKRIVDILDEAFAGIATAVANTEKNLANARELFESYLNAVFSQRDKGWQIKRVGEVADHCLGKMLDKHKNKGAMRHYLRNINVQWFEVRTNDVLQMRIEKHEEARYSVEQGDLLICEGGYPGRAAIWNKAESIFFQKALHRVRCEDRRYNRWLLYYLYLSDSNGELSKYFTGAGIQHFTGKALKDLQVPWPPQFVVDDLLERIEGMQEEVGRLKTIHLQKLNALADLKQSLLQKAFSGELTADKEAPNSILKEEEVA